METKELDTGEDNERFSWIQLPILTLQRAGFGFWRLRSWIFFTIMSWYWEYYGLVLGVVGVGIGSSMSWTLERGSCTLQPGSWTLEHRSWTLEPGSWIFFTIVSWYWDYYELDIRAWELYFFLLL